MKHLSKIALLTILIGTLMPTMGSQASSQFIYGFNVNSIDTDSIYLTWKVAENVLATAAPIITCQTGSTYVAESNISYATTWFEEEDESITWGYTTTVSNLQPGTAYSLFFEIEEGSNDFSEYADYVPASESVLASYSFQTQSTGTITTYNRTYVSAGDTVRIYGTQLGSGPADLDNAVVQLGPEEYEAETLSGNYYQFPVTNWTSSYIEVTVPDYDADVALQRGKLYFDDLLVSEDNYNEDSFLKVINDESQVDRAIASGYQGSEYRHLLNSSRFRYNSVRTGGTLAQEQAKMGWVKQYLIGIGKGIDATWSLVLAYGLVYGGYSEDEIQHEIHFGPGCLQASIAQDAWSQTRDYTECMANTIE